MGMKQKNHSIFNRYTVSAFALLVVAAASTLVVLHRDKTDAAASVKPGVGAAVPSQFSSTGATGWWQGATNKTSMALFEANHNCFTSVEHKSGTVDVAAENQKWQDMLTADGYTVASAGNQALTLQTTTGPQSYTLQQFSTTGSGNAGTVKAGNGFGYIQLANSYIKVSAVCDTTTQLPETTAALQSIKFDESK
jgi:hypothetical protein